jgi:hypothetical protein
VCIGCCVSSFAWAYISPLTLPLSVCHALFVAAHRGADSVDAYGESQLAPSSIYANSDPGFLPTHGVLSFVGEVRLGLLLALGLVMLALCLITLYRRVS